MTNLRARMLASIVATGYNGDARLSVDDSASHEFEFGESGASRGNFVFDRLLSLTPSQVASIDLGDGTQQDAFGLSIEATRLSVVCIHNTGNTSVGLSGTCPAIGAVTLPPGGVYLVSDPTDTGYSTGGESGTIVVTNQSGSVAGQFQVTAIGVNGS